MDLAQWVEGNGDRLAERWLIEVASRSGPWEPEVESLMSRFFHGFVSLLPGCLGPLRSQIQPLWVQAAELYGSLGSMRALAAGDIIEEFQSLREALIRLLYADPPKGGAEPISLRELLLLNRIVDRGVTQASVGHTDALFFALIEGSGLAAAPTSEVLQEVGDQLDALQTERDTVLAGSPGH